MVNGDFERPKPEGSEVPDSLTERQAEFLETAKDFPRVFSQLSAILRELAAKIPELDSFFSRVYLSPSGLSADLDALSSSISKFISDLELKDSPSDEKLQKHFFQWLFQSAHGPLITHTHRLLHFIEDYCPLIKDVEPTARSLMEQSGKFVEEQRNLDRLFEKHGFKFHRLQYAKPVPAELAGKISINQGMPIMQRIPTRTAEGRNFFYENFDRNKAFNMTVSDVTAWGWDSDKYPELTSNTNLYLWWM